MTGHFLQFALRLLAFRQIHKVLGMDPLPQMNSRFNVRNNRKRRRDNSDGTDGFEAEGKKDKKDYEGFWSALQYNYPCSLRTCYKSCSFQEYEMLFLLISVHADY